jgi:hypothetical protein
MGKHLENIFTMVTRLENHKHTNHRNWFTCFYAREASTQASIAIPGNPEK